MPSWWGKPSSKEGGKKDSILSSLLYPPRRKKNKQPKEEDICVNSVGAAEAPSSRTSGSSAVGRSASFGALPSQAQPLPLPPVDKHHCRKPSMQKYPSFPLPPRKDGGDIEVGYPESGSSSASSLDVVDAGHGTVGARVGTLRIVTKPDQTLTFTQAKTKHGVSCPTSPHLRSNFIMNMAGDGITYGRTHGILNGTADSYLVSPVRSTTMIAPEMVPRSMQSTPDPASGHGSSPGSGHNSTVDTGQTSWCQSRASPELSPIPSPRRSPGPGSRVQSQVPSQAQSQAVSPLHKRAGGVDSERSYLEAAAHRLPLPPSVPPLVPSNFPPSPSASAVPPRSPTRSDSPTTWQKGKLIGRGSFGNVFVGFDSENVGRMCAMKEVPLLSDDSKSKESVKQLSQEIATLSRLRHPNIVQYYGSDTMEDGLYIYLEYVSGGSIHKLLQEYGAFKEPVIRSYTRQILSGLAYLHSTNTVHRDIKGANILVDTNGVVKLADFGMAKHLSVQSFPLSFKGSPYWMAPEVIKPTPTHGYELSVDIWSLGCTVLEMATAKPPWSQYEGVAAMFKIGNSKEIPAIPDHLSKECKDFLRLCLRRNPTERPTAMYLLGHPFVCNAPQVCTPDDRCDIVSKASTFVSSLTIGNRSHEYKTGMQHSPTSELSPRGPGFASSSASPCASPKIRAVSPHHLHLGISSSQSSSPVISSGSSTPITGGYGNVPRSANGSFAVPTLYNEHQIQKLTGGSPVRKNGIWSIPPSPTFEGSPRQKEHNTDILGMALGRVPREDDEYFERRYASTNNTVVAEHFSQQLLRSQQMFPRSYVHSEKRDPTH